MKPGGDQVGREQRAPADREDGPRARVEEDEVLVPATRESCKRRRGEGGNEGGGRKNGGRKQKEGGRKVEMKGGKVEVKRNVRKGVILNCCVGYYSLLL